MTKQTDTPTGSLDIAHINDELHVLEENLQQHFDASAEDTSPEALQRMKAKAQDIPAKSPDIFAWKQLMVPATLFGCLWLFFLSGNEPLPLEGPQKIQVNHQAIVPTEELVADASTSQQPPVVSGDAFQDAMDLEPYLDIGWEDDFDLDLLHEAYEEDENNMEIDNLHHKKDG